MNTNLEDKYENRKGIYVLTYTGVKPYKIGMTNSAIWKRINNYINCPSQHDGHYIHLLLTWDIDDELNARNVEKFIFDNIEKSKRMNSTQRRLADRTEHFDVELSVIKSVMKEAKKYYENKYDVKIYLDEPKEKSVKTSKRVKGKNIIVGSSRDKEFVDKTFRKVKKVLRLEKPKLIQQFIGRILKEIEMI